jgi:hypothetical protein
MGLQGFRIYNRPFYIYTHSCLIQISDYFSVIRNVTLAESFKLLSPFVKGSLLAHASLNTLFNI